MSPPKGYRRPKRHFRKTNRTVPENERFQGTESTPQLRLPLDDRLPEGS